METPASLSRKRLGRRRGAFVDHAEPAGRLGRGARVVGGRPEPGKAPGRSPSERPPTPWPRPSSPLGQPGVGGPAPAREPAEGVAQIVGAGHDAARLQPQNAYESCPPGQQGPVLLHHDDAG